MRQPSNCGGMLSGLYCQIFIWVIWCFTVAEKKYWHRGYLPYSTRAHIWIHPRRCLISLHRALFCRKSRLSFAVMPMFVVNTNVAKDAVPAELLSEATQELAKAMGKPAQYIAIHIIPDQMMMFGGKGDPCTLFSHQHRKDWGCAK
ncbi:hypothetical protein G5714_014311 [Onychostoma macrolepis]|uniref:Macrophage migration inhibitory factor n=1 Tax=Onychostoma macrolepis TaxID=369639 RepID=A0A7J6CCN2_9TELE|nr:hypothetical protein G5714_014311 [Onychostoma macrolepis]